MKSVQIASRMASIVVVFLLSDVSSANAGTIIDDFSFPATSFQQSLPGESRAGFPPGATGGNILALSGGSDIARDRGLFGQAGALSAGGGGLILAVPTGFVEFDWDVNGYDRQPSIGRLRNSVLSGTGDQTR
ncbi:MAG: hypothetical protein R3E01_17495 [Pirellulaceae bacterium]